MNFKKVIFSILLFLWALVAIETVSSVFNMVLLRKFGFYAELERRKSRAVAALQKEPIAEATREEENNIARIQMVYHPYLGYVRDPNNYQRESGQRYHNLFNFPAIVPQRRDDQITMLITGGSVAGGLGVAGLPYLLNTLSEFPSFHNKTFEVYHATNGGYKQPQQLLSLNLILAMGGHFDIVINLDGFNDIVLPVAENIPNQVSPYYPRRWDLTMSGVSDRDWLIAAGRKSWLEEMRLKWIALSNWGFWKYSPTQNLLWLAGDAWLSQKIDRSVFDLQTRRIEQSSLPSRGPAYPPKDKSETYRELADFWRQCSLQMHTLCNANGIRYFHFLQPNQYVPDSKPFTDEENRLYRNNPIYKVPAEEGYPYLMAAGDILLASGVDYCDLTFLFDGITETIYRDDCCHYNDLGRRLVAEEIGRIVGERYSSGDRLLSASNAAESDPRSSRRDGLVMAQGFGGRNLIQIQPAMAWNYYQPLSSFLGTSHPAGQKPEGGSGRSTYVSTGDVDGDGDPDIVVSHGPIVVPATFPNLVSVHDARTFQRVGHPFSAFLPGTDRPVHYSRGDIRTAVGRFLSKDAAQIAVAQGIGGSDAIRLYQYTGKPAPQGFKVVGQFLGLEGKPGTGGGGLRLAAGDLDGDGIDELLVCGASSSASRESMQCLKIDAQGRVSERIPFAPRPGDPAGSGQGVSAAVLDLDGQGQKAVIAASQGSISGNISKGNWISVIVPAIQNGKITGFVHPEGGVYSVFDPSENPSGAVNIAAGNLDGNPDNGGELAAATGERLEGEGLDIRPIDPAPQSRYRILKAEWNGNSIAWRTLPASGRTFRAFEGTAEPPGGAVHMAVAALDE